MKLNIINVNGNVKAKSVLLSGGYNVETTREFKDIEEVYASTKAVSVTLHKCDDKNFLGNRKAIEGDNSMFNFKDWE